MPESLAISNSVSFVWAGIVLSCNTRFIGVETALNNGESVNQESAILGSISTPSIGSIALRNSSISSAPFLIAWLRLTVGTLIAVPIAPPRKAALVIFKPTSSFVANGSKGARSAS